MSAQASGTPPEIEGRCDSAFGALRDAFRANFVDHDELGAALAVSVDGTVVTDIWAGWADGARTRPWQHDTLVDVFSVGKPMAAICLLMLVEQGEVELDRPVADYWPQFAAAGKQATTVRMILAHRAGLPALRSRLAPHAMYDWEQMTSRLACEEPWWEPGARHGYHVNTFGFLVGEIVRRVSGQPIGVFFQRNVADPLGAEFHFGLPAREHGRVAEFLFPQMPRLQPGAPPNMTAHAYMNPHGLSGDGTVNTAAWREAEMPSSNGHSNARAVAAIYGALAGTHGATRSRPRRSPPPPARRHAASTRYLAGRRGSASDSSSRSPSVRWVPARTRTGTSAQAARWDSRIPTPVSRLATHRTTVWDRGGRTRATARSSTLSTAACSSSAGRVRRRPG